MTGETILVVDNEETCALLKQSVLSPAGYEVITAASAQAGLAYVKRVHLDLILLELEIAGGSSLDFLAALRKVGCPAPAILMTTHRSGKFGVEAFRLGIRDSLDKPFTVEQVHHAIDRALEKVRLARERENLHHNLLAAEAVRMTVTTLSHYLNNNLMAISGVLTLLEEALHQEKPTVDISEMIQNGKENLQGIQAVLRVLCQTTDVEVSLYSSSTPMIDIEAMLKKELRKVHKPTRKLGNQVDCSGS